MRYQHFPRPWLYVLLATLCTRKSIIFIPLARVGSMTFAQFGGTMTYFPNIDWILVRNALLRLGQVDAAP